MEKIQLPSNVSLKYAWKDVPVTGQLCYINGRNTVIKIDDHIPDHGGIVCPNAGVATSLFSTTTGSGNAHWGILFGVGNEKHWTPLQFLLKNNLFINPKEIPTLTFETRSAPKLREQCNTEHCKSINPRKKRKHKNLENHENPSPKKMKISENPIKPTGILTLNLPEFNEPQQMKWTEKSTAMFLSMWIFDIISFDPANIYIAMDNSAMHWIQFRKKHNGMKHFSHQEFLCKLLYHYRVNLPGIASTKAFSSILDNSDFKTKSLFEIIGNQFALTIKSFDDEYITTFYTKIHICELLKIYSSFTNQSENTVRCSIHYDELCLDF